MEKMNTLTRDSYDGRVSTHRLPHLSVRSPAAVARGPSVSDCPIKDPVVIIAPPNKEFLEDLAQEQVNGLVLKLQRPSIIQGVHR
jgi:hypothetical protein